MFQFDFSKILYQFTYHPEAPLIFSSGVFLFFFIVFFAICCFTAKAFHIVGGEIIYDYLFECIYANHPLGRQILGKSETIQNMTQKRVFEFYKKYYHYQNKRN